MAWYQTAGWVVAALGVLIAGPGVVKLLARPKSWRVPAAISGGTFSGVMSIAIGLELATAFAVWAVTAVFTLLAAQFLVWANNVRVRRRQKDVA